MTNMCSAWMDQSNKDANDFTLVLLNRSTIYKMVDVSYDQQINVTLQLSPGVDKALLNGWLNLLMEFFFPTDKEKIKE